MKRPGKQPATACGSKTGILKPVFGRSLQVGDVLTRLAFLASSLPLFER